MIESADAGNVVYSGPVVVYGDYTRMGASYFPSPHLALRETIENIIAPNGWNKPAFGAGEILRYGVIIGILFVCVIAFLS